MFFNGFHSISRTRRRISTRRHQKRRKRILIKLDDTNENIFQEFLHIAFYNCCSMMFIFKEVSCWLIIFFPEYISINAKALFFLSNLSNKKSFCVRYASFVSRFIRLRSTAFLKFLFETAVNICIGKFCGKGTSIHLTVKGWLKKVVPFLIRWLITFLLHRRSSLQNVGMLKLNCFF